MDRYLIAVLIIGAKQPYIHGVLFKRKESGWAKGARTASPREGRHSPAHLENEGFGAALRNTKVRSVSVWHDFC